MSKDFLNMTFSDALKPAVTGTRKDLSQQALEEIKQLMGPRSLAFVMAIIKAWVVIISVVALAVYIDNIFFTIFAIFIVATRQNVLGLMVHDQAHYTGIKHKYGDLITDFFAGYPLIMMSVKNYAKVHLTHHKYFLTEKDPDLHRKSGKDWIFPMEHKQLAKIFLKDLVGLTIIENFKGKNVKDTAVLAPRLWETPKWVKPLYFLSIALFVTYTNSWDIVLIYWILPLVTFMQIIVRWGGICEHRYIYNGTLEETTPLIIKPWWENLIMPSQNFMLHVYHHYYANISFCNLPKVHEIFVREGLVDETSIFQGSWDYLKSLLKKA